jgi:hypothetical protein
MMRLGVSWVEANGLIEAGERLFAPAQLVEKEAADGVSLCVLGPKTEHTLGACEGLVEAAEAPERAL